MIVKIGNIFESKAQTLVNTVNCVGVMGKGVALEFKKRYPAMFQEYVSLCKKGEVLPGKPYYYSDLSGVSIINFPTKNHWRSPSKLSYIVDGLIWFRDHYQQYKIQSVAFPPLGCGNGGLSWELVGPLMYRMLKDIPIEIEIYAPYGTKAFQLTPDFLENNCPTSPKEILGSQSMPFNPYWLLILYVVQKLNHNPYALNVGRTIFQKVCYILTRVGIPTGFQFKEGYYGPYAKEVDSAVLALSNANYMTERQLGRMVETIVSPSFILPLNIFSQDDISRTDRAYDLLSRIKNTDQAEMIATVLFTYDELSEHGQTTEQDIFDHVLAWKPHWRNTKEDEIRSTICELSALGWMSPKQDTGLLNDDDDLF